MKLSKTEFDRFVPLWHVVVRVDYLVKDKYFGLIIPERAQSSRDFACHTGVIVKIPRCTDTFNLQKGYVWRDEFHLKEGDKVWYGWEASQAAKDKDSDLLIEVDDTIYLLIPHQEILVVERGSEKFGVNGYVGGKRTKSSISLIYTSSDVMSDLVELVTTKAARELNMSGLSDNEIEVTAPPKSYPEYDMEHTGGTHVPTTRVVIGEKVGFPEGLAIPISSAYEDDFVAVHNSQIMYHSS